MEFNVLGLMLKLKLMPKISTDTPLSKNRSVTGRDRKQSKTSYNWSKDRKKPVLIGPVRSFDYFLLWLTGYGLGPCPWGSKDRTGPDF